MPNRQKPPPGYFPALVSHRRGAARLKRALGARKSAATLDLARAFATAEGNRVAVEAYAGSRRLKTVRFVVHDESDYATLARLLRTCSFVSSVDLLNNWVFPGELKDARVLVDAVAESRTCTEVSLSSLYSHRDVRDALRDAARRVRDRQAFVGALAQAEAAGRTSTLGSFLWADGDRACVVRVARFWGV